MLLRDRIKAFRRIPSSQLRPNPRNWRTHNDRQRSAMQGILADLGIIGATVVRELDDGTFELIDGHLRADLIEQEIPCLVVDLDEAEAVKALATYDPVSAMAGVDASKLKSVLDSVSSQSNAVTELIDRMRREIPAEEIAEDSPAALLESEPTTKRGDVWQLGSHRLMCGDCRLADDVDKLCGDDKINVAVTSPPYAAQREYDTDSEFEPPQANEYVLWFRQAQEHLASHIADNGSFFLNIKPHCEGGQRVLYVADLLLAMVREWGWQYIDELVWVKPGTPVKPQNRFKNGWEPIYHFAKSKPAFYPDAVRQPTSPRGKIRVGLDGVAIDSSPVASQGLSTYPSNQVDGKIRKQKTAYPNNVLSLAQNELGLGHSAAFPVRLPAFFIRAYSLPGDVAYDPFAGSGSTLIAAHQTERRCLAMEISPRYCDLIVRRWVGLTGGEPVLLTS